MKIKLLDFKELKGFPSASGIEFAEDQVYLVGDDANDILVMTKQWKVLEKIKLSEGGNGRMPKNIKHDFEASTVAYIKKVPYLMLFGSGSTVSHRSKAILVNLDDNSMQEHNLDVFYSRLKGSGVEDLNIEAAAMIDDNLIFCNRNNNMHPDNLMVITKNEFWKNQESAEISVIKIDLPPDQESNKLVGLSGLAYSPINDWLIFTSSTENRNNSFDDGKIGDSYIGLIENASRKIGRKRIKVNSMESLAVANEKFSGYKVESVCIQSEKEGRLKLHLAAENDSGMSYLFKVRLKNE